MPNELFGVSFQPGAEGNEQNGADPQQLQEAVKLLNLRLPTVFGARSPVAPQLLQSVGGQGLPQGAIMAALRALGVQGPGTQSQPPNVQIGLPPRGPVAGGPVSEPNAPPAALVPMQPPAPGPRLPRPTRGTGDAVEEGDQYKPLRGVPLSPPRITIDRPPFGGFGGLY